MVELVIDLQRRLQVPLFGFIVVERVELIMAHITGSIDIVGSSWTADVSILEIHSRCIRVLALLLAAFVLGFKEVFLWNFNEN